jgi:hypothetical protein
MDRDLREFFIKFGHANGSQLYIFTIVYICHFFNYIEFINDIFLTY